MALDNNIFFRILKIIAYYIFKNYQLSSVSSSITLAQLLYFKNSTANIRYNDVKVESQRHNYTQKKYTDKTIRT